MLYKILMVLFLPCIFLLGACKSGQNLSDRAGKSIQSSLSIQQASGSSSGMVAVSKDAYLVVYDIKNFKEGIRIGFIEFEEEEMIVSPISVENWDAEGISSDLESICKVPGTVDEFLISESGNWQAKLGRIFHIKVDFTQKNAEVLSSFKLPLLNRNDIGLVGDQYEAMHCLPKSDNEKIIILGERGGSGINPEAKIRWGIWNMTKGELSIQGEALSGIKVDAPGNWSDSKTKRSITDFYVDREGIIWASASEDLGDFGPFYSVIYKLGMIQPENPRKPFRLFDQLSVAKEIHGLKVEALAGPKDGIKASHSFASEDEIYGGVWRPINISSAQ